MDAHQAAFIPHNELRELGSEGRRRVRIFQCRARSDVSPLALLKDFVVPALGQIAPDVLRNYWADLGVLIEFLPRR